jgi:hypothetical protein
MTTKKRNSEKLIRRKLIGASKLMWHEMQPTSYDPFTSLLLLSCVRSLTIRYPPVPPLDIYVQLRQSKRLAKGSRRCRYRHTPARSPPGRISAHVDLHDTTRPDGQSRHEQVRRVIFSRCFPSSGHASGKEIFVS